MKLSTKAALFKRVTLLIGGASMSIGAARPPPLAPALVSTLKRFVRCSHEETETQTVIVTLMQDSATALLRLKCLLTTGVFVILILLQLRFKHYRALQLMVRIDFSNIPRMLHNFDSLHFRGRF